MKTPTTESERHELRRNEMRASDVATELNVSITQVYQYIEDGELTAWEAAKKGAKRADYRITRADFERFRKTRLKNAPNAAA
jgi:hypothetical protein